MKTIGNLLLTMSLITGMIAAATSYFAFLDGSDEALTGLQLKAPAGAMASDAAALQNLRVQYDAGELTAEQYTRERKAIAPTLAADLDNEGTLLTAERLAALRAAGVGNVFAKGFSFGRWRLSWLFLLSAVGLLAGSLLVRTAAKAEVEAATLAHGGTKSASSPQAVLEAIATILAQLQNELASTADEHDRFEAILTNLDKVQKELIPVFIDARALLVGKLGLAGYAELMDRFAAAERQVNRAWSAAADHVYAESELSLGRARELLDEARTKLPA